VAQELGRVFDQFPRYDKKTLLGDLNAKIGREDIFKPTIGNESSHEISNDNGVRVKLSGSTLTTAWRVLGLRIEETASRYGG
jgi:hypothetical protein